MTFTANEDTTVDVYFTKESYDNNTPNDTISLIANQEKTTTYDRENIYKFKLPYTSSLSSPWISYVYNIKYLKIEGELLDCSKLFYRCLSLINLDTTKFYTSKVTDMNSMFEQCNLSSLDLSNFDTSKVTNMSSMFNMSNLTSLDLSNFDTSKVTNMSDIFGNCYTLTSLDISNFDTSKVTDMSNMFRLCYLLTTVKVINCSSDTQNKILSQLQSDMSSDNGLVKYDWVLENGVITRKEKQ